MNIYISAYGHNFTPDDSAKFLTFVDEFDTEIISAMKVLDNSTLMKAHIEKASTILTKDIQKEISEKNKRVANELSSSLLDVLKINSSLTSADLNQTLNNIRDILLESESSRLDSSVKQNITIQALHFANLLDLIEKDYKQASKIQNQNNSNLVDLDKNISSSMYFDTTKVLFTKLQTLYSQVLYPSLVSKNATHSITTFDDGLTELQNIIFTKKSYNDLLNILHGTLHSELLKSFNLQLKKSKVSSHDMSGMSGMSDGNNIYHNSHM